MPDDQPSAMPRRGFFREAVARVVSPLVESLQERTGLTGRPHYLRPPGAIEESLLLDTCQRCGACVDICPANAIFALDPAVGDAAGTPAINADLSACVVCEGLVCTTACPSGALLPVIAPTDIRMGVAEVYSSLCVRTQGESCTLCVDRCPIGDAAIVFESDGPPTVYSSGCVGCGVCQFYCPTEPKAITVRPT